MEAKVGGNIEEKGKSTLSPAKKTIPDFLAGTVINLVSTLLGSTIAAVILFIFRIFTAEDAGHSAALNVEMALIPLLYLIACFPMGCLVSLLFILLQKRFLSLQKYRFAMKFWLILWTLGVLVEAAIWGMLKSV